jgi:hypothetical protein
MDGILVPAPSIVRKTSKGDEVRAVGDFTEDLEDLMELPPMTRTSHLMEEPEPAQATRPTAAPQPAQASQPAQVPNRVRMPDSKPATEPTISPPATLVQDTKVITDGPQEAKKTAARPNEALLMGCPSCQARISKRAQLCPKCGCSPYAACQICASRILSNSAPCPECGDPEPFSAELP